MVFICNGCNKNCKSASGFTRHLNKCYAYDALKKRQKIDKNNFRKISKFDYTDDNHQNLTYADNLPDCIYLSNESNFVNPDTNEISSLSSNDSNNSDNV